MLQRFIQFYLSRVAARFTRYHRLVPTGRVREGLFALKTGIVNCFVAEADEGLVAFDAGISARAVQEGMKALGLSCEAVTHLFLTHGDWDHTGGIACFSRARVFLSAREVPMIDGTRARGWLGYRSPHLDVPYEILEEGQEVDAGGRRVEIIETPGHTPGSVAYRLDGEILLTGDTVMLKDGRARPAYGPYNVCNEAIRQSLRKLARLEGVGLLCSAHTGMTEDFARAMAPWREA